MNSKIYTNSKNRVKTFMNTIIKITIKLFKSNFLAKKKLFKYWF